MDGQDEVVVINNNNNNNNNSDGGQSKLVVKGKRTKRQRPQSPIPFMMITNSPTNNITTNNTTTSNSYKSDEGSDICSNNNLVEEFTTATTTNEDENFFGTTDEEEDMANCLILLAQGKSRPHQSPPPLLSLVDNDQQPTSEANNINNNSNNNDNNVKFVSRKFMEAPSSTPGKLGYYVYECKTCGKTFSSFQALGGHRASHKKPKNKDENYYNTMKTVARSNKNTNLFSTISSSKNTNRNYYNHNINNLSSDDEDPPYKITRHNDNYNNVSSSTSLSLQLMNRALWGQQSTSNNNKGRVHECSICAAEFSSGQALGGHMRRHRGPLSSTAAIAAPMIAAVPLSVKQPIRNNNIINDNNDNNNNNNTNMLSLNLDLNLPAPPEDNNFIVGEHQRERSKFVFEQTVENDKEQQPPLPSPQQLVFSSSTLVDCHY